MKHPLRDRLLASFPGAIFGGIIREYNTGLSGADVFAARFEPSDQSGLNGTYIIKIVAESSIEAEKEFFNQATSPELARMIAPLCRVSNPIDGFVAVAYEVAFNLESIRTLADILTTETALPEEKVALLIERLCAALVTYHIE